jgi:hypothetical protein
VTNLSKYGILDGSSFYPALFKQSHTVKQQLFFHYCPHPGFTNLLRWVRDKTYKLYDSADAPHSGKFYNTVNDEKEQHSISESALTAQEKQIKQRFKNILDTIGTWPEAPTINNAFSDKITNNSVRLTATIISSGPTMLTDRGSTLIKSGLRGAPYPYLESNRMHDSIAALGTFLQLRKGLVPQTSYKYSLYAMNKNQSHSTAFAADSFYTLSNPPLLQPASFTATVNAGTVTLKWGNAKFPSTGSENAGYLLIYSRDTITILQNPNGKAPGSIVVKGQIIPTISTVLPTKAATSAKKSGLGPGVYQFKLIPYTWNGTKAATYNYLTTNARTTTTEVGFAILSNAIANDFDTLAVINEEGTSVNVYPNPVESVLNIELNGKMAIKKTINLYDVNGKPLLTKSAKGDIQIDMKQLTAGTYLIKINDEKGKELYDGKVIKQ